MKLSVWNYSEGQETSFSFRLDLCPDDKDGRAALVFDLLNKVQIGFKADTQLDKYKQELKKCVCITLSSPPFHMMI